MANRLPFFIPLGSLLLLALSLGACGDDKAQSHEEPDASTIASVDAAPMHRCPALKMSYDDLGQITGRATLKLVDDEEPEGPFYVSLKIPLNQDTNPDILGIELWPEEGGPFEGGIGAQTVALEGDQADIVMCSACVFISADFISESMQDYHIAYGGKLILDAVDLTPGTGFVRGSLENVKFTQILVTSAGQELVPDGCHTSLKKISFDFKISND